MSRTALPRVLVHVCETMTVSCGWLGSLGVVIRVLVVVVAWWELHSGSPLRLAEAS